MLSPSPALSHGHGRGGLAQTAPGLGESRLQTGLRFCQIILGNTRGGHRVKKKTKTTMTCQPSTVEIKVKHQQHPRPQPNHVLLLCGTFEISGAKPTWRSDGQSGQHRQSLKTFHVWSGSASQCAIALWCPWGGYCYTVCSSEGRSPGAARSE